MPSENPPIDPRYDPRFQRGYDSQPVDAAPAPAARPSRARPPRSDRQMERDAVAAAEPRREPYTPDAVVVPDGAGAAAPPVAPDAAEGEAASEPEIDYHGPAPRRSNPWLAGLWAIGIGLVVLGVGMIVVVQSINQTTVYATSGYGDPTPRMFIIFMNVAYSASGPFITVGLATIVGLLFLRALRRGPRVER